MTMSLVVEKKSMGLESGSAEKMARAERNDLVHEFDGGVPVAEIAQQHGRSRAAINLRLVKLGKIDAESAGVRERARKTP